MTFRVYTGAEIGRLFGVGDKFDGSADPPAGEGWIPLDVEPYASDPTYRWAERRDFGGHPYGRLDDTPPGMNATIKLP